MQPGLFQQQQHRRGDHGAGQREPARACQRAGGQHDNRRHLGGAVDVDATRCRIRGDHEGGGGREQHDGQRQQAVHREPSGEAADAPEQRERANAAEAGLRAAGVTRPLSFETDGRAAEHRHAKGDCYARVHAVYHG